MLRRCVPPALLVAFIGLIQAGGLFQPLQNWITDARFSATSRPASGGIVLVEIDAKSLDAIGVWPWPRSLHARAIDRLVAAGAAEIAFDVDFSAVSTEAEDLAFENALKAADGAVALPTFRQPWSRAANEPSEHINEPLPRFARHAWAATVNVVADPDGKVRTLPIGDTVDGEFRASIAALYGGIPQHAGTSFTVDFSIDPHTVPRISFIDVIEGRTPRHLLAGKQVLIGAGAVELGDHFAVPAHGILSGPLLQIIGAESLSQGRALSYVSLPATILLLAILGALSAVLCRRMSWQNHVTTLGIVAIAVEIAAYGLQLYAPLILETAPVHVLAAILCLFVVLNEVDLRDLLLRIARAETKVAWGILDRVVSDNFDGIVVISDNGEIDSANHAASRILGRTGQRGDHAEEVLPAPVMEHVFRVFAQFAAGERVSAAPTEIECALGGRQAILETVATPSRLGGDDVEEQTVVCLTFRDVTERNRARAKIDYMAHFDTLTGLANRNRLQAVLGDMLQDARADGNQVAVIYFDLDRFKGVNDTLGHTYGDLLLKEVATRATGVCRDDGVVARFGGDEFVLVQPGTPSAASAGAMARTLLDRLHEPCDLDGHRVIIGGSAGIAMFDGGEVEAGEMIRRADAALHKAKADGGNRYAMYEPEFSERLLVRRQIELDLWKAFEQDEFEVFFQPQIDLATGQLDGAEALLRWNCPERGYVSPAEFIPVAEDIGLIPDLGAWTLMTACIEAAQWPLPLKLAVNVSAHQFRMGDLMGTVECALAIPGFDHARLELEITESLLADENPVTAAILEEVRELGIGLALDDFCTGYSSLSYVRRFPITKIKIDRSFVSGIPEDAGAMAIIRAVVELANALDLRTTAEGIETAEQLRIIGLSGCDQGQGYHFSKPLAAAQFRALVEHHNSGISRVA